jgi:hypothetical protein
LSAPELTEQCASSSAVALPSKFKSLSANVILDWWYLPASPILDEHQKCGG